MERLQEQVKNLVLSRKQGESIDVGGIMRITVIWIKGKQCKLLIQAPDDIPVMRTELADRDRSKSVA